PLRWRVRELNPSIDSQRAGARPPLPTAYVRDRIIVQGFPADDESRLGSVLGELSKAAAELGWELKVEPEDLVEARLLREAQLGAEAQRDIEGAFGFGLRIEPAPGTTRRPADAWDLVERFGYDAGE